MLELNRIHCGGCVPTIFSRQGILDTSPHQHRHASRQYQPSVQPQPARPLDAQQPGDGEQLVHLGQASISVRRSESNRSATSAML